ncbi:uncharacterized protein LOC109846483 [Asparagus officinalis]|uniref:uncharacterized protein LOC109846483 n=1 Tax=Asparagus officinalis TaxID=4686 RepID=UPI00098E5A84|nr:uncharacterized protein LOC109846483 [Asparagus officinalis]
MKKGCSQIPATGDLAVAGATAETREKQKPPFRPAKDDTKPVLRDPILRSDPIESEQAVLRLPPFPNKKTHS